MKFCVWSSQNVLINTITADNGGGISNSGCFETIVF